MEGRQARELGVFSFVAGYLRLWAVSKGQGEVSGWGSDSGVTEVLLSLFGPKLSGSLFGVSKWVNGIFFDLR